MQGLNITATEDEDKDIWQGDVVEILLETQPHSYYQLTVNPAGALTDLDRPGGSHEWAWSSQASAAAYIGEDAWQVELRIPVTGTETTGDPLHELVGTKPREDYPWYFNICRQRIRGDRREFSSFAPKAGFHDVNEFGRLYVR